MERWKGRTALVTGASMGIGRATAKLLAKHGMNVAVCARSIDKLHSLQIECQEMKTPGIIYPVKTDLCVPEEVEELFKAITENFGGVDVCINSAGVAFDSPIINGGLQSWEHMWKVNVIAVCQCTYEAVKSMRSRDVDDGHIININSLSGHRVGKAHFYSATKYAVTSLTEGIRWELRSIDSHIRVSSISPGLVKTNFAYNLMGRRGGDECYKTRQSLSAEDVAKMVEYILAAPKHVQISEVMMRPTEQEV